MSNSPQVQSVKALDALNKIRALSVASQFLCSSDIEDECRADLLSIIEDICTRVTDAEIKQ